MRRLVRLPGVYRPQTDTRLLTRALDEAGFRPGVRVLDLCTGSGAVAMAAARAGAAEVVAVDRCRRAVLSAWLNGRLNRLPLKASRGDLSTWDALGRFDVVLANPPYVPADPRHHHGRGVACAWDAGPDGRRYVDALCERANDLLEVDGTMLMVHSDVCDPAVTLDLLRERELKASVAARCVEPFGPVMRERRGYLERTGLIEPGQQFEELVVIRADRPALS
ncbi:HemK2/MTQ2 family protein methyltransferase [Amycolatopsis magusensis]|uniref:HemK2/MTQ2 family protein methyltransferase n=1 Tax=Amycolatopsis magusensis TaxID=882444 RepID=UPI003555E1DC